MRGGTEQPVGRSRAYLAFLLALGLGGWAVLLAASYLPGFGPPVGPEPGPLPFALFLLVIVIARGLAFQLLPRNLVSLDSAFYVAATICLGSQTAGLLVALALTLDSLMRLLGPRGGERLPTRDWPESLSYVLYFGGMTGALILGCGWLFGVDRLDLPHAGQGHILAVTAGLGLTLLTAHYAIQALRQRMLGETFAVFMRRVAAPGILAELSLLPLAAVVVLIYDPRRPLGFALLGATYLLINLGFNRLIAAGRELRRRVSELETLDTTARRLTASLQLNELVETVARETVRALPAAEVVTLAHEAPSGAGQELIVECYDAEHDAFQRTRADRRAGVTGWVMTHGTALAIPDARHAPVDVQRLRDSGVRSWMGTPVVMYGAVRGVLAVQSRRPEAFGADDRRLLDSLGIQVSVALQNAYLYELAMVDGLTGLFVRRYFDARLDEEIERARRYGTAFSLAMMDIDDFKRLNDTHGHQAGDEVLRAIADVIRTELRGVDVAARYGGEEFAMILPRTDMVSAYNLAERVRGAIAERRVAAGDQVLSVTASFGIAAYPESGTDDAAELIRRADRALYRAKKTGKDRVELFWDERAEPDARSSMRSVK